MKKDEIHFILVEKKLDGQFKSLGKTYKAKTALQAAKKGYRDNKNIEKIYVYDSKAKTVHGFDTSSFFTVKKPQKKK